ncbi:sugar phosphate isomerase/epimerase family protein [Mycobacterium sp. RTGN5]|uniref:sugar phosphate isomerase/epimerase family protein n=1 Tax=Mycobacterium sp. RTGN5 TaxID=3016522 RepID=UPI0029C99244|nr:sugar phosphate isomerase/epimerase family protein [Mycobacterium sp. RTGN5]
MPHLVATAWTSAGNTSPLRQPQTSPVPIEERVAAVAEAGYSGMGLVVDDLVAIRDTIGFDELRKLIDDNGLTHVEIELIERWWIPRGQPGHTYDARDVLFEAADGLEPKFIKIGSELGPRTTDIGVLIAPLRQLADQAADHGTKIAIETMPFSIITTVPMGAELVTAAGHSGVGLLIDAWHVFRAGTSMDELAEALAPAMIFGVELNDAAPEVIGELFEDTLQRRLFCGEGCFDLPGLIAVLRDKGFDGPWGIEILSRTYRKLPPREGLKLAAETTRALL